MADAGLATEINYQLAHLRDDRGSGNYYGLIFFLVAIATTAVSLRLVAKRLQRMPWTWDDACIGFALACYWALVAIACLERQHGFGRHTLAIGFANVVACAKLTYAFELVFTVTATAVKLALLLFYWRLFAIRSFRLALYPIAAIVTATGVAVFLALALQCRPLNALWDKSIPGTCSNTRTLLVTTVALNTCTDILVLVTPLPKIWRLQMSRSRKLVISGIFSVGGLACVAAIARIAVAAATTDVQFLDFTWSLYVAGQLFHVEASTGIICACLPMMRPLIHLPLWKRLRLTKNSSPSSSGAEDRRSFKLRRPLTAFLSKPASAKTSRSHPERPASMAPHLSTLNFNGTIRLGSLDDDERLRPVHSSSWATVGSTMDAAGQAPPPSATDSPRTLGTDDRGAENGEMSDGRV
ncbi:MAG: hypothetical protein M1826_000226 [Phylliscum demangeonii]|nr:MAG: hypothetical protein M1826_000226 [Phylliscum demangeonii]